MTVNILPDDREHLTGSSRWSCPDSPDRFL